MDPRALVPSIHRVACGLVALCSTLAAASLAEAQARAGVAALPAPATRPASAAPAAATGVARCTAPRHASAGHCCGAGEEWVEARHQCVCLEPGTCASAAPVAAAPRPATYGLRPESRNTVTRGGDEGTPFSLRCPAGQVGVGVTVRSESSVYAVALSCAPIATDGALGDAHATRPGGGPGGTSASERCPAGQVVAGLTGRSGVRIDRVGVQCAPLTAGTVGEPAAEGPPQHGGNGGDAFADTCPAGHAVTGFDGRAADTLVALRAQCTRVAPNDGPNAMLVPTTVRSLGTRGVVTVGAPFALHCPAGEVAVGVTGSHTSVLNLIALDCAHLYPDGSLGVVHDRGNAGGDAGEAFSSECTAGRVLVGLNGRSGRVIDRIGAQCATVDQWMSPNVESEAMPAHGGTGGDPFRDVCPPGHVVYGLSGRAGNLVDSIQVECVRVQR